jgi:hypothetical protein
MTRKTSTCAKGDSAGVGDSVERAVVGNQIEPSPVARTPDAASFQTFR